jgi:hypothetical protein
MRYNAQYVADVLRLIADHFRARGYSNAWLLCLAEDAVSNWRWNIARRAVDLFWKTHEHDLVSWEKDAINYIDYLFTLESIVWASELRGEEYVELTAEVNEEEELPL